MKGTLRIGDCFKWEIVPGITKPAYMIITGQQTRTHVDVVLVCKNTNTAYGTMHRISDMYSDIRGFTRVSRERFDAELEASMQRLRASLPDTREDVPYDD